MINFKDSKDQTPSALAVVGMLLILGSVIFTLFFSRGMDAKSFAARAKTEKEKLKERSLVAKSDNFVYSEAMQKYQWEDNEDVVTPAALTIVSKRVAENQLNLVSFRPLKSIESGSMRQLPFQFTVDGPFANVASMLESLEKSDSKLTVQQVQFASQEGETDLVSANISLLAYIAKPILTKSKPTATSSKTSSKSSSTNDPSSKAKAVTP
jgi:hypothetical protein